MTLWVMLCRATQDRQVTLKSSDKIWSTGEGNGNPSQYSCQENLMNSIKRQKERTPGRWTPPPPNRKGSSTLWGKSREQLLIAPKRMKQLGQSRNAAWFWMCLVVKVKSNAIKNSSAQEPGMLGPWIKVNWTHSSRRWQDWSTDRESPKWCYLSSTPFY